MRSKRWITVFAWLVAAFTPSLLATTFLVPTDAELVNGATAIVRGTVLSSAATVTADGQIVTVTQISTDEAIKGEVSGIVEVVEAGGVASGRAQWIYGTPSYEPGERVLVFLSRGPAAAWRTSAMLLGKFTFEVARSGERVLVRGSDEHSVFGFTVNGEQYRERTRLADDFLQFVRESANGQASTVDYYASSGIQLSSDGGAGTRSHVSATSYSMATAARWTNNATAAIGVNLNGAPAAKDWNGAAQRASGAWNGDSSSNINYTIQASSAAPFNQGDGQNVIVYNANPSEFGGAIGLGGWAGSSTHFFGGANWITISEVDVKISANANGFAQTLIDAIVTHELGHTLGFRHSDEAGKSPNSSDAIMKSAVSPTGAILGSWDREALAHVYGSGTAVCEAVAIAGNATVTPTPVPSGGTATLSITTSGSSPFTFAWFRGDLGDTSTPAGNAASINAGPLYSPTSYWVRVTNSCNSTGDTRAVLIDVAACTAPSIVGQPQDRGIVEGQSTTLSVQAAGAGTMTYQWYVGETGDTSTPVLNGATATVVVHPATTTRYWVRVGNSCSSATTDSQVAAVIVGTCTLPSITREPEDFSINVGATATLTVGVSGTGPFTFQWFRGQPGDTSRPVGSNSNSITVNPTETTTYWVGITNRCGEIPVRSVAVTVTVNQPCTGTAAITQQPADQTIEAGTSAMLSVTATGGALSYQWFIVSANSLSAAAGGTNRVLMTSPLKETTSFLVQVRNACGAPANSRVVTVTVRPDTAGRRRSVRR